MDWKVEVSSVNAGVPLTQVANGTGPNGTISTKWASATGAFPDASDYVITVSATDTVPSTGSNQLTGVVINNTNFIKFTFPTEGATVGGLVRAVGQAGASWSLRWDNVTSAATGAAGAISVDVDSTTQTDGAHTLVLAVTNNFGDVSTLTHNLTIKNDALPVVRLTAPLENATIKGTVNLIGEAHSPDTLAHVTLKNELGTTFYDQVGANHAINVPWDTIGLSVPDGTHTLTLLLQDSAGNENRVIRNVIVKNVGPIVNFSVTPTPGGFGKGTLTISGTVTDTSLKDWKITVDGGTTGVTPNTGTTSTIDATWNTTVYNDGPHVVKVVATDTAGNTGQNQVTVTTDNTKPRAEITAPPPNTIVTGGTLTVTGTATDANLDFWEVTVDGGTTGVSNPTGTGTVVNSIIDTTLYNEGNHTIKLAVFDKAGNEGDATVTFIIDKTGPLIDITAPIEDAFVKAIVAITGTAKDPNLKDWVIKIDGVLDFPNNTGTVEAISANWDTRVKISGNPKFPDGPHTINVTATDKAGNITNFTRKVKVDNTPPKINNVKPEKDTFVGDTVAITATIEELFLDKWTVTVDGQEIDGGTGNTSEVDVTWDTTNFGEGNHTIRIQAIDKAGNITNSDVVVTIDRTPPVVKIQYPFANLRVAPGSNLQVVVDITDLSDKSIDPEAVDGKLRGPKNEVVAKIAKVSSASLPAKNGIRWIGLVNVGKGGGKAGDQFTIEISVKDKAGNGPTVAKKIIVVRF